MTFTTLCSYFKQTKKNLIPQTADFQKLHYEEVFTMKNLQFYLKITLFWQKKQEKIPFFHNILSFGRSANDIGGNLV